MHIPISAPPNSGAFSSYIGITFLAYVGSGVMVNAAGRMRDPQVIIPRASLVAVGITMLFYISLALVLLSDISALELEKYADTAVAQVASPPLGHVGYVIAIIGALLTTTSATNADLLAVFNIMGNTDSERKLPRPMNRPLWRQSTQGDIVVVVLVMLMTTTLNLGSLASVANATLLVCYLAVFMVAIRLRHDIHISSSILIIGTLVMLLVIAGFVYSPWSQSSRALIWIIGSFLLSFIMVMAMKRNKTV